MATATIPAPLNIPGKVRLVKDVLRVGRWKVAEGHYWHVTSQLLDRLVKNFDAQLSAGHRHPLQWGHGVGNAARDGIDDIRQLSREGDTLFMAVYVTPQVAKELTAFDRQVSVRVEDTWETQQGEVWDNTLVHVAVVDHGAVSKQQPFRELSAGRGLAHVAMVPSQKRFKQLSAVSGGTVEVSVATALINRLLRHIDRNARIPDGLNADDFRRAVAIVLDIVLGPEAQQKQEGTRGRLKGKLNLGTGGIVNLSAHRRKPGKPSSADLAKARNLLGIQK